MLFKDYECKILSYNMKSFYCKAIEKVGIA